MPSLLKLGQHAVGPRAVCHHGLVRVLDAEHRVREVAPHGCEVLHRRAERDGADRDAAGGLAEDRKLLGRQHLALRVAQHLAFDWRDGRQNARQVVHCGSLRSQDTSELLQRVQLAVGARRAERYSFTVTQLSL